MEPHGRDENEEDILEDMIRGEDDASHFLNDFGEGDESLNAWKEAELGISATPSPGEGALWRLSGSPSVFVIV